VDDNGVMIPGVLVSLARAHAGSAAPSPDRCAREGREGSGKRHIASDSLTFRLFYYSE
jgi:hypothetical protein